MKTPLTGRGVRRLLWLRLSLSLSLAAQAACGGWRPWGGGSAEVQGAAPSFRPGFNLFSPEQDVEIGRQSAAQIAREAPLLRDGELAGYVSRLGAKLAAHAPGEKFPYQFQVVASREVNAFALPGGFIFVNAGTLAAARNEGELAGVVAHEILHVALRHGTNQASKAYVAKRGLGVLRSVVGDGEDSDLGRVIDRVGGVGANMLFLKFGRSAERQSDLGGAHLVAAAGYDPRDMAAFFETLQREGGRRVPEFLSDHPDPGDRIASINEVVPALEVRPNPTRSTAEFERAKAHLTGRGLPASAEPERKGPREPEDVEPAARPLPPAEAATEFRAPDGSYSFSYPRNWETLQAGDSEQIIAPAGAYGRRDGAAYVTHGLFVGTVEGDGDLRAATDAFLQQQLAANPDFHVQGAPRQISLAGREAYAALVAGPSPVTGKVEVNLVHTAFDSDGRLFYLIAVTPEEEFETYRPSFESVVRSLRLG